MYSPWSSLKFTVRNMGKKKSVKKKLCKMQVLFQKNCGGRVLYLTNRETRLFKV